MNEEYIEVYVYRWQGGYGDGFIFSEKELRFSGISGFSEYWMLLGKFRLPLDFLKAIGWDDRDEDYLEVGYVE